MFYKTSGAIDLAHQIKKNRQIFLQLFDKYFAGFLIFLRLVCGLYVSFLEYAFI